MRILKEKIAQEMAMAIKDYTEEEISKWIQQFVDEKVKEGFHFGRLVIEHFWLFGGDSEEIFKAAAAMEFLILSLDIFDDLQDQDNPLPLWSQMDSALAMNLAIACQTLSQQILSHLAFDEGTRILLIQHINRLILRAVKGQQKDLINGTMNDEEYLEMVEEKSGSLMAAACITGSILATGKFHDDVLTYGQWLGTMAQIQNDMKDILRWDLKNDLLRKKKTLPVLYLLNKEQDEFPLLKDYYKGEIGKEAILQQKVDCIEWIKRSGAVEYVSVYLNIQRIKIEEHIANMNLHQEQKEQLLKLILIPV